jgi:hypothetical protein
MHLKAQAGLVRADLLVPRGDASDHGRVIEALRHNRRDLAGELLSRLRRLREYSDYRMEVPVAEADWLAAKAIAIRITELLGPDWS